METVNILVLTDPERVRRYYDLSALPESFRLTLAGQQPSEEALLSWGSAYDVILASANQAVGRRVIESMPRLRLIQSEGVAYNAIDLSAASERGVLVCNCAGVNASAVAEQAVMLMLVLLRRYAEGRDGVLSGRQMERKKEFLQTGLHELGSQRVGLIGMGAAGQATAALLHAFGAEVCYTSRTRLPPEREDALSLAWLSFESLLERCDIVSLHCPVTEETKQMIGREALRRLKPGAYLINTARGELVDTPALYQALVSGRLGGYGADVFCPEPLPPEDPLLKLPPELRCKLALSPHIAGTTHQTFLKSHRFIWENIMRLAVGETPKNRVNG